MLTLCTVDAVVVATTNNHLHWLGRDREGVIGHRCSEWADADCWDLNWHLFQHALSTGMPVAWERSVLRLGGGRIRGQITVKPILTRRRRRLVLCANRVTLEPHHPSLAADFTHCVAALSEIVPPKTLHHSLEELAADAASLAATLYAPH